MMEASGHTVGRRRFSNTAEIKQYWHYSLKNNVSKIIKLSQVIDYCQ